MSESLQTQPPPLGAPASPWPERRNGVLWVLGLHLVFIGLTAGIGATVGSEPEGELVRIWIGWVGLLQGIYVFPAILSAALVQRWQLMMGMGAAAAVTLVASLIRLALA